MENKHMKICNIISFWVFKLKQQETTVYLLERPQSRRLISSNAGEDMEQQELSFIASENAKWYRHFEGHFGAFLQN